jgi:serine/threonine protein kinase
MHRNLKPHNILIQNDGTVKISDFTLSRISTAPHFPYTPEDPKVRERSTRETRRLWYRAPEMIFRKEVYAFEVDLWSIGCLLAELALGEPLFKGETEVDQLFKIFRLTGTPSEEVFNKCYKTADGTRIKLPNWPRIYFGYACYNRNSEEFKTLVNSYLKGREEVLYKLMELKDTLGSDGMDLLWKLLDLDTQNRISAGEALQHPFLSDMESDMEIDATGQNHTNLSQYEVRSHIDLLKKNEELLRPDPQYMSKQSMVSESMRTILVDWLVDVSMHFEVMGETLHFAIGYIDRTLSVLEIEKNKLQLVGVTCMKIADVFNEKSKEYYRQDNASEYAYITADEYTSDEVIKMEKQILTLLDFNCYSPTVIHFLKLLNMSEEVKLLSNYLADLMLLTTKPLAFKPSLVANSIMYLACGAINNFEVPENNPELFKLLFGEYPFDEF